jgi:hypothetical protein
MGRMGDLSRWSKHRREILRRIRLFNSDPNCNSNCDAKTYPDGNRDSHSDGDYYAKTYPDGHNHGHSCHNAHSNSIAHTHYHTKADPYTATCSDTESSTDSRASAMNVTSLIEPSVDFQRRFARMCAREQSQMF